LQQQDVSSQSDVTQLYSGVRDLDRQIDNVANAIAEMGGSDSLKGKLKKLERKKHRLLGEIAVVPKIRPLPDIYPDVGSRWKKLVTQLESLDPGNPAFPDARKALLDLLGEVKIRETNEGVEALISIHPAVYKQQINGAQKRT
jgi:hypothetical protein